jgi:subtilase family serine protease
VVLALAVTACAEPDPVYQMTEQELATATNAATCSAPDAEVHCHGRVITDSTGCPHRNPAPAGFGPTQLKSAYKITGTGSTTTTVAMVEAFGYANAEADLGVYRTQFALPSCTTANGCFRKVNQSGATSPLPAENVGWAQETAVDLDMISAICRNCKLLVVEASSTSFEDIAAAVQTAVRLGAHVVNNSYGGDEYAGYAYDSYYNYANIAMVASTGDVGYGQGAQFPSSSEYVTAVGGTTLTAASNARGWTETTWINSVSGCSILASKPSWQHDTGCPTRMVADVAAVADPNTGVAVYGPGTDTSGAETAPGWLVFGGTSVAAPIIAGVYGVNGGAVHSSSDPYTHPSGIFDITSGLTGFCDPTYYCNSAAGYDGPTGVGTPNGSSAF